MIFYKDRETFKPFQTNVLFLYLLKTSENLRFSDVFRGCSNGKLDWNELNSQFPKASSHKLRISQKRKTKKNIVQRTQQIYYTSATKILLWYIDEFVLFIYILTINAALQLRFFKTFCLKAPFQTIQVFCISLPENNFLKLE